ncbi:Rieske 2Fe-2S domain-containing protein [Actinomadura fibrosa]|uniref:Rieske 2Fe-2S domain-containing protein n=1 Tax=Actinomadura fibrosa TaxID=111802 RepID=A0ABW2XQR1_9ACTN|nr:Rieske (2Fe-2S) protein [Actinomadura fibrosa]
MRTADRLEETTALDTAVEPYRNLVQRLPAGRAKDFLHGVWLGHPLHPAVVQMAVGAYISAGVLDLMGGDEKAVRRLVGFGLLSSVPAAVTGAADWSDQHEQQQRVGIVHAAANSAAAVMYLASLAARSRRRARAFRFAGLMTASLSSALGGHMSFRQAAGANHAEAVPHLVEPGWHRLAALDDLPVGTPIRRMLGEVPVVVVRQDGVVRALADQCSHLAGPLSGGEVDGGAITCPWHGSTFRLSDGGVVCGPATAPQPAFETQVRDGDVYVCLPGTG